MDKLVKKIRGSQNGNGLIQILQLTLAHFAILVLTRNKFQGLIWQKGKNQRDSSEDEGRISSSVKDKDYHRKLYIPFKF